MPDQLPGPYSIGSDLWPGLSRLIEESGEVQQVAGKLIGAHGADTHYDDTDLRDRLTLELGDLYAAFSFVVDSNDLDWAAINQRSEKKRDKYNRWHRAGQQALARAAQDGPANG